MIKDYAREAGVRNLRQLLEKVSRKAFGPRSASERAAQVALKMVRKTSEAEKAVINLENLSSYIGQPWEALDVNYLRARGA